MKCDVRSMLELGCEVAGAGYWRRDGAEVLFLTGAYGGKQ